MILIMDIDETLIHSRKGISLSSLLNRSDVSEDDIFSIGEYIVQKRPHLDTFLENILNDDYYEVGIWSAGSYEYVHDIVDMIIPDQSKLKFIMTSRNCNEVRDKPLAKVRDLYPEMSVHDYIIIDDRHRVTGHDHLNHLQIYEFEGDTPDDELVRLWEYLDTNRYYSSEYLVANWRI